MSDFDKWWEENYMNVSANRTEAEDIYNLGVESQQDKIDLLEVQLKGAEERAKLALDHKNKMVDELQKENDKLNIWYKNVKLQLENKQIDCDRSDRKIDELQARFDEITNHVGINFDEERDDDQHSYWSGYNQAMRELNDILKGNKDEN